MFILTISIHQTDRKTNLAKLYFFILSEMSFIKEESLYNPAIGLIDHLDKMGLAESHSRGRTFEFKIRPVGAELLQFGVGNWQSFSFWDRLPMEVIFIWNICKVWFGHIRISLKFRRYCNLKLQYLAFNFWGRLPLEVVFISNIPKVGFGHIWISLKILEDPTSWRRYCNLKLRIGNI